MKRNMLKFLIPGMVFLFLTITGASANSIEEGLEIGDRAPDFELNTLEGETMQLSDFKGERVMINFWATWCPPCRQEMPDIERFYQEYQPAILSVNLTDTEMNTDQVERFRREFELTFPFLLDHEGKVADLYRVQPIPMTYMIDAEGVIQFKMFGALSYEQMVKQFEQMK